MKNWLGYLDDLFPSWGKQTPPVEKTYSVEEMKQIKDLAYEQGFCEGIRLSLSKIFEKLGYDGR